MVATLGLICLVTVQGLALEMAVLLLVHLMEKLQDVKVSVHRLWYVTIVNSFNEQKH